MSKFGTLFDPIAPFQSLYDVRGRRAIRNPAHRVIVVKRAPMRPIITDKQRKFRVGFLGVLVIPVVVYWLNQSTIT